MKFTSRLLKPSAGDAAVRAGGIVLLLLCLFSPGYFPTARAQVISEEALKKIKFDQKLGAQVSPNLQFRDENGKLVRLGDYLGKKPVILVLGYYGCPMLCTFVLNGMIGSLQDIKWEIGNQFEVINVSIDPHETPALAAAKKRAYVRRYGRHDATQGWHFLTGEEPAIQRLAAEVGFGYAYDARIKQYAHPSGLVILTSEGKVSHYLSGVMYSTKELNEALLDASAHKVGSPIQQLFLLCFHYTPITGKYGALIMYGVRATGILTLLLLGRLIVVSIRRETPRVRTSSAAQAKTD
jgi:protein SCO1